MSSPEIIPTDTNNVIEEEQEDDIPQQQVGNLKDFTYHITDTSSRPEDSDDDYDHLEATATTGLARTLVFTGFDMTGQSDLRNIQKCTGETLWPCSRLLADYLQYDWKPTTTTASTTTSTTTTLGIPQQVLELGCGLGLCGTVASVVLGMGGVGSQQQQQNQQEGSNHHHYHPDSKVIMTDGDASVIDRTKRISQRNCIPNQDAPVSSQVFWWGDDDTIANLKQSTTDQQGFDLIVASDVLYMSDENFVAQDVCQVFVDSVDRLLKKVSVVGAVGGGAVTPLSSETKTQDTDANASTDATDANASANAKCCMAFQHRNVCVSVLVEAFAKRGFISYSPPGDYFQDIYGERGDERTMFNAMFLLVFERRKEEEDASTAQ
jgi:hypothetical protein